MFRGPRSGGEYLILNKEKHAEAAIEKIRRRCGADWGSVSMEDISLLREILGEAWVYTERTVWDKIAFSEVTIGDLYQIIGIGRNIRERNVGIQAGMEDIVAVLQRHSCTIPSARNGIFSKIDNLNK